MSHIFENDVKSLVHLRMRVRLIPFKEAEDQNIEIPESFPELSTLEEPPIDWLRAWPPLYCITYTLFIFPSYFLKFLKFHECL